LLVGVDPIFNNHHDEIIALAARQAVPRYDFYQEFPDVFE